MMSLISSRRLPVSQWEFLGKNIPVGIFPVSFQGISRIPFPREFFLSSLREFPDEYSHSFPECYPGIPVGGIVFGSESVSGPSPFPSNSSLVFPE
jgi:hypothetical protein